MQRKKKICKSCDTPQHLFSKGRCERCAKIEDFKPLSKGAGMAKKYSYIKPITEKTKQKKKEQSAIRNVYFDYHIERCTHSEESDISIPNPNRSNICHLFAKSSHKSLQAHLENYVYLTFEEHSEFDNLLFKNDFEALEKKFPNVWTISCERIKKLLPLCEEQTKFKIKIEEYLNGK